MASMLFDLVFELLEVLVRLECLTSFACHRHFGLSADLCFRPDDEFYRELLRVAGCAGG